MTTIERVDWHGCYDGSWQGELVPDAFAHPAKIPFALAERIYRHMLAEGWLAPGDRVVDPFGGIAGTAFHALLYGLHWQGVELEPKFVALAEQNIALWNERYAAHMPNYGSATIRQGDSRKLASILADAQAVVSSPPYMEQQKDGGLALPDAQHIHGGGFGHSHGYQQDTHTPGQLAAMPAGNFAATVSSPPYSETRIDGNGDEGASGLRNPDGSYLRGPDGWEMRKAMGARYGETPGNLGNLPAGCVSSPPYAESINQNAAANDSAARRERKEAAGVDMTDAANVGGPNSVLNRPQVYADNTPGQLGAMPQGDHDAAVSSPPYADAQAHPSIGSVNKDDWGHAGADIVTRRCLSAAYADNTPGQLGDLPTGDHDDTQETVDTFWSAARTIVEQTYAVLRPGAVAAWVTGDFVRNKQRVPFGEQWLALCESVGFEPLLWAVAWKHEDHGAQLDIFGNEIPLTKSKVSFFRRLANAKNPDAAILNEDVIFVRKPA